MPEPFGVSFLDLALYLCLVGLVAWLLAHLFL